MEASGYSDMEALQASNWWFEARRELIRRIVDRTGPTACTILDVGCGTGANADALSGAGRMLIGVDASEEAVSRCRTTGLYTELHRSDAECLPLPDSSVDLALCADVLEHTDDVRTSAGIFRVLKPGGVLIVTVPAHMWLWSWNDELCHHRRRYSSRQLRSLLENRGFVIRRISSWNISSVLPAFLISSLQRFRRKPDRLELNLRLLPPWLDRALLVIMRIENALVMMTGLPIGVSLFVVAEKPAQPES
jgi:SAM-dependent methyltransferase